MALVGHLSGSSNYSSRIGISGSVIIANAPNATFPSMPGSDVQFYVHQQAAVGAGLVSSGSLVVKGSDGSTKFSADNTGAMSLTSLTTTGDAAVGGQLQVTGLTGITGSLDVAGIATFGQATNVGGNLAVGGGYVTGVSDGGVTAYAAGNLSMNGDLLVEGDNNTINMLQITGSSGLNVSSNATVGGNLVVTGDLTVNGTTVTVDATTLTIEDPLVGLGFTSGSTAVSAGDRGFVGGLGGDGSGNVAMYWSNGDSEFRLARTTSTAAASSINFSAYAPVAASVIKAHSGFSGSHTRLTDGTSAFIAGSGITIASASNGAVTISSSATTSPGGSNQAVQFNDGGSFGGIGTFSFDKTGGAGGFGRLSVNETLSTVVTSSNIKAGASTVSLFNDTATTINMGGSATTMLVGASNVAVGIGGVSPTNSTITASTGSFGRVLASSTSTFTGAATFNGGLTTTTLAATSTSNLAGNITLSGNSQTITHSGTGGLSISSTAGAVSVDGVSFNSGAVTGVTTLQATSDATIGGTLSVVSSVTGSSTATFQGLVIPTGGISVSGGSTSVQALTAAGLTSLNGDTDLGNATTDSITFTGRIDSDVLPIVDSTYNLGSVTNRWANIYTGDLHLRNERGDYTLIEEPDFLSIRFNKTGKRYKFVLEPVPELDEELGKFSTGPAPAGTVKSVKKVKAKVKDAAKPKIAKAKK